MTNANDRNEGLDADAELLALFAQITSHRPLELARLLDARGDLASRRILVGATRNSADGYFLAAIRHHVYAGDTALHIAAAAYQSGTLRLLVEKGANVQARNRRGAEPIHYAADGSPGADYWDPVAQSDALRYLVEAGADPNAFDKSGVAPLHRAVRTRSALAVATLIENGAYPRLKNKRGSTPLHLAVQNTGRSNSGSDAAKEEQGQIIELLLDQGANPNDTDANGKTAALLVSSKWIGALLNASATSSETTS